MYSKYSDDLEVLGFEQELTIEDGGRANYMIEIISASNNSYQAKALAVSDFDGDGIFNEWEINQDKQMIEITKD